MRRAKVVLVGGNTRAYNEVKGFVFFIVRQEVVMCTFDSPISRCELMRCMVLTDQTQRQCAAEHGCPEGVRCPLVACFTGVEIAEPVRVRRPVAHEPCERLAA